MGAQLPHLGSLLGIGKVEAFLWVCHTADFHKLPLPLRRNIGVPCQNHELCWRYTTQMHASSTQWNS